MHGLKEIWTVIYHQTSNEQMGVWVKCVCDHVSMHCSMHPIVLSSGRYRIRSEAC